jgi:hypothetical protein
MVFVDPDARRDGDGVRKPLRRHHARTLTSDARRAI